MRATVNLVKHVANHTGWVAHHTGEQGWQLSPILSNAASPPVYEYSSNREALAFLRGVAVGRKRAQAGQH